MPGTRGRKEQHELVPADARDRRPWRGMGLYPARDPDQQAVPDIVTIGVVYGFEAVQVDQHGHERTVGKPELADGLLEPVPVEQVRQRVPPGVAFHLGSELSRLVFEAARLAEAGLSEKRASDHSREKKQD